jgi:hypothetical protein
MQKSRPVDSTSLGFSRQFASNSSSVGAYRLHPHKPFMVPDTRPAAPCELTERKQMTAIIDQSDLDLSVMESWEVYTATGKTFRLGVIPWYRR